MSVALLGKALEHAVMDRSVTRPRWNWMGHSQAGQENPARRISCRGDLIGHGDAIINGILRAAQ